MRQNKAASEIVAGDSILTPGSRQTITAVSGPDADGIMRLQARVFIEDTAKMRTRLVEVARVLLKAKHDKVFSVETGESGMVTSYLIAKCEEDWE